VLLIKKLLDSNLSAIAQGLKLPRASCETRHRKASWFSLCFWILLCMLGGTVRYVPRVLSPPAETGFLGSFRVKHSSSSIDVSDAAL